MKLYLPGGPQSGVFLYQGGKWKNFDHSSSVNDAADEVVLNLADGGAGDQSGTDGVINDPVGIAQPNVPPPAEDSSTFIVRTDNVPEPGVSFAYQIFDCGTGASPAAIGSCTAGATSAPLADSGATHQFSGLLTNNHWYRVQRCDRTRVGVWRASRVWVARAPTMLTSPTATVPCGSTRAASGGACSFVNAENGTVSVIKQTDTDGDPTTFPVHLRRCGNDNNDNACSGSRPLRHSRQRLDRRQRSADLDRGEHHHSGWLPRPVRDHRGPPRRLGLHFGDVHRWERFFTRIPAHGRPPVLCEQRIAGDRVHAHERQADTGRPGHDLGHEGNRRRAR